MGNYFYHRLLITRTTFLVFYFLIVLRPQVSLSQQNFINVPSSELTEKHKLFFQQQLNFNELIQSNTTLDFGLGSGFEAGVNVLGLNFSRGNFFIRNDTNDRDPYNPLVLVNGMKQVKLSEKIIVSSGLQYGLNFNKGQTKSDAGLFYANLQLKNLVLTNGNLVLGAYYNSLHYGGSGNRFGAWFGMELELYNKLHLLAESVLGNNALCFTSLGFVYYANKQMPLTLALQIPNSAKNAYSIVFELTIIPKKKA